MLPFFGAEDCLYTCTRWADVTCVDMWETELQAGLPFSTMQYLSGHHVLVSREEQHCDVLLLSCCNCVHQGGIARTSRDALPEAGSVGLPVPLLPQTNTNEVWDPHKPHMPVYMRLMWEASCRAMGWLGRCHHARHNKLSGS